MLLAGIVISAKLSYAISDYMQERARIPLYNLPLVLFGIFFIISVIATHFVTNKVHNNSGANSSGMGNRFIGVFVNATKYIYLMSVVLIFVYKIDSNLNFIHQNEKKKTFFYYKILSVAPGTFKILVFPEIYPIPIGRPEELQKINDLDEF
jgi:hypothetical protein